MTNKPMLLVEIELLERILDSIGFGEREELKAILDRERSKTILDRLPHKGPPVFAYCSSVQDYLSEIFPDSAGRYYNGCPESALAEPMQCWRDGYEAAKKRAISAGLKVKP